MNVQFQTFYSCFLLFLGWKNCSAFFFDARHTRVCVTCKAVSRSDEVFLDQSSLSLLTRRHILSATATLVASIPVKNALASTEASIATSNESVLCLADLPPIPSDWARIFLCRHGETDNNRYRIVQGARVDPPINENGIQQAQRLGQALRYASTPPQQFLHSPLRRARQTAEYATSMLDNSTPLSELSYLAEVDFGPVADGGKVDKYRADMVATYSKWAVGDLSARMAEGGESGYEIFARIEKAVHALRDTAAQTESRCVAAVAHSAYLRMILATLQDAPLLLASKIEQKNACINVVDVKLAPAPQHRSVRSNLFGAGIAYAATTDYDFLIPESKIIRTNEKRHLEGIELL